MKYLIVCLKFFSLSVLGQSPKPNILLILTDDMGYGDLSCFGSPTNYTPNLDKLASRGTRFARCYAGSAVCTHSRASILMGKFPLRYDICWAFTDNDEFLPVDQSSFCLRTAKRKI